MVISLKHDINNTTQYVIMSLYKPSMHFLSCIIIPPFSAGFTLLTTWVSHCYCFLFNFVNLTNNLNPSSECFSTLFLACVLVLKWSSSGAMGNHLAVHFYSFRTVLWKSSTSGLQRRKMALLRMLMQHSCLTRSCINISGSKLSKVNVTCKSLILSGSLSRLAWKTKGHAGFLDR